MDATIPGTDLTDDSTVGFWEIADQHPDRLAVVGPDRREMTFGELRRWSDALAVGLLERGHAPRARVAVMLKNEVAFLAVQLATEQLGLDLVPINWRLTAAEVGHILADSEAAVLIVGPDFAAIASNSARIAGLVTDRCFATSPVPGMADLTELEGVGPLDRARRRIGGTMLYTSGTTGRPKGVVKPRRDISPEDALRTRLPLTSRRYGWPEGDGVHLVVAPLYHAAPNGFALSALHRGHSLVLMVKWLPEECLELVQRHRVTSTHMVPTMFHRMLSVPGDVRAGYDVSSLNFVIHAGAPCPVQEKRAMIDWLGPVIYEYYSSTEGGGTAVGPGEWLERPGTVGRAWEGAQIRVLDDEGRDVPRGTVGTVYIHNTDGFEYFHDPEKTASAWKDGFFTAGDLGRLDDEGYLYLADRRVDLIISGGVNIYPAEVEHALLAHPAVADVGVVGVPDPEWGRRVHAVVELRPGHLPSDSLGREVLAFAAEGLARYKQPRSIEFRPLPRTETGKLRRRALLDDTAEDVGHCAIDQPPSTGTNAPLI